MGDVLRLGGFLVAPAEIESVLMEIDGVTAAEVVAIDRPDGARPVAFVIARDAFDESAAIDRCRARLARYKVPIRVLTIDEFPTTASANGTKIQKVKLRELAVTRSRERMTSGVTGGRRRGDRDGGRPANPPGRALH